MKHGFTLLEVIVAIAILLFGLSAIFHLSTLTRETSVGAEELAIVQLACQAKMNEILATQQVPSNGGAIAIPDVGIVSGDSGDWEMRISTFTLSSSRDLLGVRIVAQKRGSAENMSDRRFELVRWIWNNNPSRQQPSTTRQI